MADNVTANAGSGGSTFATDDIAGVQYPRTKLIHGADGSNAGDVALANGLPVQPATSTTWTTTISTALPAGTNAIGKLAANSGVDIGDVDVTSLTPGTGATNLGKAEDAVHSTGDVGVAMLAVRRDIASSGVDASGDYAALQVDSNGLLRVVASGSVSVAGLEAHDAVATGEPVLTAGVANASIPTMVASGDVCQFWATRFGALNTVVRDSAGDSCMDDGNNALRVNVVAGAASGGTQYDEDTPHVSGDKLMMAGVVRRDTPTSGVSADGDCATINVDQNGRVYITGPVTSGDADDFAAKVHGYGSHDAAHINRPVVTGGYASAAAPTAVSGDGDNVNAWYLHNGAAATVITAAGALIPGDATNGLDVDVTRVPADPFGANADAASATGSISAKLRHLAATGLAGMTALPAGTNNIGDVDVLTLPATPAGTNLVGKIAAGDDSSNRYDGATALTPKFANIDTATSGNNAIIAANATKKIRVISISLFSSGVVDVYFNDGTANLLGGTRKIKLDNTGATGAGGFCLQENDTGWFETAATNRPINLNLSAAIGVCGCVTYVEV